MDIKYSVSKLILGVTVLQSVSRSVFYRLDQIIQFVHLKIKRLYAFKGNNPLSIQHILDEVAQYNAQYVCVTGGEPMAQSNCLKLLDSLIVSGYNVSMETSGSIDITPVNSKVSIVMDIKTPSSTEEHQNRYENLPILKSKDQLKFVIASRSDFDWCTEILDNYEVESEILFSPVFMPS